MKIKGREQGAFYLGYKEKLNSFFRYIYNKKTKIFSKIIKIIVILFIGIIIGLIITGFFGSLDSPSKKIINLVHSTLGGQGFGFQVFVKGVLAENIKIPFNYLKGQFSNPDKLYIDVSFEDWQKIEYKRDQALENMYLISSDEDWVNAVVSDGDEKVDARIRLKGDRTDHWITDKWSLRIRVRNDETLYSMRSFSIQHPKTRWWFREFIYQNILKEEDVLNVRYRFVEVIINGKNKGIYALEEHFDKRLLENNNRREGPIIRFDESLIGLTWIQQSDLYSIITVERDLYPLTTIDSFQSQTTLEDPVKLEQFNKGKSLLENFRLGELKTSEVFDVDILARYMAINTLVGGDHASQWNNIRFYYNPITSKLEPIGFDSNSGLIDNHIINEYFPRSVDLNSNEKGLENFPRIFFEDSVFFKKYIKELERISEKEYLDDLFEKIDENIKKNINILHKDYPYYHFDKQIYYDNQNFIKRVLNPIKGLNIYYQGVENNNIVLFIGNIANLPLEIIEIKYNESVFSGSTMLQPYIEGNAVDYKRLEFYIPSDIIWNDNLASELKVRYHILGSDKIIEENVVPWSYVEDNFLENDFIRQKPSLEFSEFLDINITGKEIVFKNSVTLNQSLIIPKGYDVIVNEGVMINLEDNSLILSYSNMKFLGTEDKKIKIISNDGTGQGLVVIDSESEFNYVEIDGLNAASKDGWELTGALTFYDGSVKFNHVSISNINAEDSLNIIRGKFSILNSEIKNGFSDCLDVDFGSGIIEDTNFIGCGNDGLDVSGAIVDIEDVDIIDIGDKGVSIGEKSNVTLKNVDVQNCYIGIASKDKSNVDGNTIKISECEYGLAIYQKKSEFGNSFMNIKELELIENKNNYIVEKGSELILDGKIILESNKNVYKKLYPEEK